MPGIEFKLTSSSMSFSVEQESEEWGLSFLGKCVCPESRETFEIQRKNDSWSGFDANVIVHVRSRKARSEVAGIPAHMPWASNDDHRDKILVFCPTESGDRVGFEVSISLPEDAYKRLTNIDWTKETAVLWVCTPIFGEGELPVISGDDPDGRDIIWRTDIRTYEFLEEFFISLKPIASQRVFLADMPDEAESDDAKRRNQVGQILDSVDRASASIRDLRATILKVAWILGAVVVVTAFLR